MKHIWLWWTKEDLRTELKQVTEEGRAIENVQSEFERLLAPDVSEDATFQSDVNALFDATITLPLRTDYRYVEPSDLAGIRQQRPSDAADTLAVPPLTARSSHIAGAWMGRCVGCLLGKPIEGIRRPALRALLERNQIDEIRDYLWRLPTLETEAGTTPWWPHLPQWRSTAAMPEDDDTNYTVTGMVLVKNKGITFTPADVADCWMQNIPLLHTCTAERVAYRNFTNNVEPPNSALVRNPYREWIGAQIRADFFGYVSLGRPALAAELAWRDASISHMKNGIYGEMWVAAMLAAAAGESDMRRLIEAGLGQIPARSRLAEAVHDVMHWHASGVPYREAVERIHQRWDENSAHSWCHTISNAQVVTLGLLYGEGDFEKTITRAVFPCFDTDCNGATAGSIVGMMLGVEALPEKWTAVMNDTIHTGLAGYHTGKISELSREMFELHRIADAGNTARYAG